MKACMLENDSSFHNDIMRFEVKAYIRQRMLENKIKTKQSNGTQ